LRCVKRYSKIIYIYITFIKLFFEQFDHIRYSHLKRIFHIKTHSFQRQLNINAKKYFQFQHSSKHHRLCPTLIFKISIQTLIVLATCFKHWQKENRDPCRKCKGNFSLNFINNFTNFIFLTLPVNNMCIY